MEVRTGKVGLSQDWHDDCTNDEAMMPAEEIGWGSCWRGAAWHPCRPCRSSGIWGSNWTPLGKLRAPRRHTAEMLQMTLIRPILVCFFLFSMLFDRKTRIPDSEGWWTPTRIVGSLMQNLMQTDWFDMIWCSKHATPEKDCYIYNLYIWYVPSCIPIMVGIFRLCSQYIAIIFAWTVSPWAGAGLRSLLCKARQGHCREDGTSHLLPRGVDWLPKCAALQGGAP